MPFPLIAALGALGSGAAGAGAAGAGGKGAASGLGAAASGTALGSTAGTGMGGAALGDTAALMMGDGLGGLLSEMPLSMLQGPAPEAGNMAGGLLEMGPPSGAPTGSGLGGAAPDPSIDALAARGKGLRTNTLRNLGAIMQQGQRQRF